MDSQISVKRDLTLLTECEFMDEIDNNYRFSACKMIIIESCKQCGKRCKLYQNGMTDLCRKINPLKRDGLNWPAQEFQERTIFPETWPPIPDQYGRMVERSKGVHSRQYWRDIAREFADQHKIEFVRSPLAREDSGKVPEIARSNYNPETTKTSDHIAYGNSEEPDTCKSIAEGEAVQYSAKVGKIRLEQHGFVKKSVLVGFKTFTGDRFERRIERVWFLQNGKLRYSEIEIVNRVKMVERVEQKQTIYYPNYRPIQEGPADTTMFTSTWMTRKDHQDAIKRGQVKLQTRRKDVAKQRLDELEHRIKTSTGVFRS